MIITEEDVFYVREFFKYFYQYAQTSKFTIKGITILEPFNKKSKIQLAQQMLDFYGFFYFLKMGFLYVFKLATNQTIKGLSRKYKIPIISAKNINSDEYINKIKEQNIDLIVSIAAPVIFKKKLINSVPKGCINSHSALLPENKGMMPVFWTMYKKEPYLGITIHYIDEQLDNGDIIIQEKIPNNFQSLHKAILFTKRKSAELMTEVLNNIAQGIIKRTPMPKGGSYQSFPTKEDVKEFKRRGNKLF